MPRREISELECPKWLLDISEDSPFPGLEKILPDSLYYPACGFNGTPVKYLSGNIYSFVYADYGITRDDFLDHLKGKGEDDGFMHYHLVCQREVSRDEIMPANNMDKEKLSQMEKESEPFGHWSVWQRNDKVCCDAGSLPLRFSFFFLAGEMSATYQGLYYQKNIVPRILAIIQPGGDSGRGWESPDNNDSFFKEVVSSHKKGLPPYLLYGGFGGPEYYECACWQEYRCDTCKCARVAQLPERYASLWRLQTKETTDSDPKEAHD